MLILGTSQAQAPQTVFPTNVSGTIGSVVVAGVDGTLDPPTEPDFFVDASASDETGDGSAGDPWKTVQQVNDSAFSPGEIIAFKRGEEWRETLMPPSSGLSGSPITFTVYGSGDDPIINGSDILPDSWTNTSGNVWEVAASLQIRNVFISGTKQHQGVEATTPNDYASTNDDKVTITDSVLAIETKGAGAWWWDDDANKLYIYSVGDPVLTVEGSVRNYCITFTSKNYLTFENLALKNAKTSNFDFFGTSDNCIQDGLDVSFGYFDGIRISGAVTNTTVQNCHSFSNGRLLIPGSPSDDNNGHGIDIATTGAGTLVDNNECNLNAEDGCQVQGGANVNYTISNNNMHHNNEDGIDCKEGNEDDSLIELNLVLNNEQVGIRTLGAALGATIRRNTIGLNGNVAIWLTTGINAAKVHANLLYKNGIASDSSPNVNRAGIRIDASDAITGTIEVYNNTVYHLDENSNRACLYTLANANNVDARNNIFYHGGGYRSLNVQNVVTGMTERFNLHFDNSGTAVILIVGDSYDSGEINDGPPSTYTTAEGLGEDSIYADPDFVNIATNDYQINDASAAKGAGVTGLVATDIDGVAYTNPPNMGCFAGTVV